MPIKTNFLELKENLRKINQQAEICVVTKNQPVEKILEALEAGAEIIGENRVQEAEKKFSQIPSSVQKHLIGHLQSNKTKQAVVLFDVIESVDSLRLAEKIDEECEKIQKIMPIMLEVNTSGEEQKYGFLPEEVLASVQKIALLNNLRIVGLMTVAKYEENPENCRASFRQLKELSQQIRALNLKNVKMENLSMGMTNDYKIALEEGSNLIRVGTGIFGSR